MELSAISCVWCCLKQQAYFTISDVWLPGLSKIGFINFMLLFISEMIVFTPYHGLLVWNVHDAQFHLDPPLDNLSRLNLSDTFRCLFCVCHLCFVLFLFNVQRCKAYLRKIVLCFVHENVSVSYSDKI